MSDTAQAVAYLELPVAASTNIAALDHVCYNAAGDIVKAADTSGLLYAGQAASNADNSGGAAGDIKVKVIPPQVQPFHKFIGASVTKAWHGLLVYFVNATTVALAVTTTNDIPAGTCVRCVDTTSLIVDTTKRA